MNVMGMGATYKAPQTPEILSTFIPPEASGYLVLAETLPRGISDRMLRMGSSNCLVIHQPDHRGIFDHFEVDLDTPTTKEQIS